MDTEVLIITDWLFLRHCLIQPLVQGKDFLLGLPDSETYLASIPQEPQFDIKGTWNGMKKMFPPLRWLD
jgi:hypothetical protein